MIQRRSSWLLCLLWCGLPGVLSADDQVAGPAEDRPELQVLDRLRGEWAGTIEGDEDGPKLSLSSRWILGGHVLETRLKIKDQESLMLRTYDAANQQYVDTFMDSNGTVLLMTGQWDEQQQELKTSVKSGDAPVTLTTRFVDEQTTKWTVKHGDVAISGLNRRIRR